MTIIIGRCIKFNKKIGAFEEALDEDKFLEVYVKEVIKGWKGFKYKYLEDILLVNLGDLDPEDELKFTQENAELLMKNSPDFDTWVTESVGDLENFTKTR